MGIALALRLHGLTATSLSMDECTMVQNAQGILTSGYPPESWRLLRPTFYL